MLLLWFSTFPGCRAARIVGILDTPAGAGDTSSAGDTDTAGGSPTAMEPSLLVDLNMLNRPEVEVNEPGFTPWFLEEADMLTQTFGTVTVTFERAGNVGTALRYEWYKAGVQAPILSRLVGDGMVVADGDAGAAIRMTVSGLPAGVHSLLTYHNTFINAEGVTFAPIDIYVNDVLVVEGLVSSNRALSSSAAATAYINAEVAKGEDLVVLFQADTDNDATWKNVALCGFEINAPDAKRQASDPTPVNGDTHVDADDGSVTLAWQAAKDAVSHSLYVGTDRGTVEDADPSSAEHRGVQTGISFIISDLYSMETYYWRVDETDASGQVTKGDVWSFQPRQLAYPGAEGHGRFARGGRGGKVVYVTNLNDSGAGSLRQAVTEDTGPRTVVFNVSGVIALESLLKLDDSRVTIAGQTAPGKGICIRQAPFGLSGVQDVIVSHIRLRVGAGRTFDGLSLSGSDHTIMDHCAVSWTVDEAFSARDARNVTLQRSLISEPLTVAGHEDYPDGTALGYGGSIGGNVGSYHHNLIAHAHSKNWSLNGGLDAKGEFAGRLDIYNNVVYNWQTGVIDSGAHEVNIVNNYFKPGPASASTFGLTANYEPFPGTQQYYFAGNVMPGVFDESNQDIGKTYTGTPDGYEPWVLAPYDFREVSPASAGAAYKNVLSDVGCSAPALDNHDQRVITETLAGTASYMGSTTGLPGIIDHEADVGGFEDYPAEERPANWDSDLDGLPDFWEKLFGLNPNSSAGDFSEAASDPDMDGFTALDDYLVFMGEPHYFSTTSENLSIDLPALFRGYTDNPLYAVTRVNGGTAVIQDTTAVFTAVSCGLASVTLQVSDAAGDSMTRTVGIFVDSVPAGGCGL